MPDLFGYSECFEKTAYHRSTIILLLPTGNPISSGKHQYWM
jgi:hypothetical protein